MLKPIKLKDKNIEYEVEGNNWPLVSDLLSKWGITMTSDTPEEIKLPQLQERIYELGAWGITWKRTK